MSLKEKVQADIKKAMVEKDQLKVSVLRMLMAAVFNKEKEKRAKLSKSEEDIGKLDEISQLTDEETTEVISSENKKRRDSIEQYEKGNRQDLADQENKELKILEDYLPGQMSEEEIRKLVKEKITQLGASNPQDTGKIMGVLMPQLKGKADGNIVSKIVQEELRE